MTNNDKPNSSKRRFLKGAGANLAIGILGSIIYNETDSTEVTHELTHWWNARKRAQGAEMLEHSIFPFDQRAHYLPGSIHFERLSFPQSMQMALNGLLKRAGVDENTVMAEKANYLGGIPSGNIVTVGSPSSNEVAFALFNNQFVDDWGTEYMANSEALLPLKVTFGLDKTLAGQRRINRGSYWEPDWQILVDGETTSDTQILIDGNKHLKNDYLVITKAPNVFDPNWHLNLSSILSISGVHGPGTQGFGLLLENEIAVDQVLRLIHAHSNLPYWQILVRVEQVGFDPERNRDFAATINTQDIRLYPIDISDKRQEAILAFDWDSKVKSMPMFRDLRAKTS